MGGCANSKYAVDEDKMPKKEKKPVNKKNKNKKDEEIKENLVEEAKPSDAGQDSGKPKEELATNEVKPEETPDKVPPKADKEDIEFIDKEDAEKQAAAAAASANPPNETSTSSTSHTKSVENDDTKKEITTYQTTVVKHTQKEGDELFQHLKDEAFRTLQNLLKQQSSNSSTHTTRTTTATTPDQSTPETSTDSSDDDIVEQIKNQVVNSIGKSKQGLIHSIIEQGADLVKENKVKNMSELQSLLEKEFPDTETEKNSELVGKVIASTTGFLTAKGTEAGVLLSKILANASSGLQGVMNETEKTTVKVTRTVTEQIMSGGQLKEITKVITSNEPIRNLSASGSNIQDVLKNLSNGYGMSGYSSPKSEQPSPTKVVKTGTTTTTTSTTTSEKHENVNQEDLITSTEAVLEETVKEPVNENNNEEVIESTEEVTKKQAEQVVTTAVNAAVEQIIDEVNKIEESTYKEEVNEVKSSNHEESATSTSSHTVELVNDLSNGIISEHITNGHHQIINDLTEEITEENIKIEEESSIKTSTTKIILNGSSLDQVQSEFYKHGKQTAEELIKKINQHESNESSTTSTTTTITDSSIITS